jgi:phosphohistidine phosphatase
MAVTRQLFVLRHAKSSWDDPGLDDHERPLAPRGRRAIKVLAEHFRDTGVGPALILCSSARRTVETLDGIGLQGQTLIEDELYAASPGQLLERLHRIPGEVESAMVIGHNPTMQVLVLRLAATSASSEHDGSELAEVQRKFPTGAVATLTFEGEWSELAPGGARLTGFVRPKQLVAR